MTMDNKRRIVPTQIVDFIEKKYPWVKDNKNRPSELVVGQAGNPVAAVATLVLLLDKLQDNLLDLKPEEYINYINNVEELRLNHENWKREFNYKMKLKDDNPFLLLREILSKCPNEPVLESSGLELGFIKDSELRQTIAADIYSANSSLNNSQWKASVVFAGACMEAILLDAIKHHNLKNQKTQNASANNGKEKDENKLHLHDLIDKAKKLGLINSGTADRANYLKDFRNLIHPGCVERTGENCDRAKSFQAIGILDEIITVLKDRVKNGMC